MHLANTDCRFSWLTDITASLKSWNTFTDCRLIASQNRYGKVLTTTRSMPLSVGNLGQLLPPTVNADSNPPDPLAYEALLLAH